MGHAIANTFKSVVGSSVTTVAGFSALCIMTFALGRDLGIVMGKGVIIGVICCVTILPALILVLINRSKKQSTNHFSKTWRSLQTSLQNTIKYGWQHF